LERVLLRLRKYNLKLNPDKSVFGATSVHYLGYTISGQGIRPGQEKLQAIKDFPEPDTPRKIREFIGLANYFRFLIPDFAVHSQKLTNLFKKESEYKKGKLPPDAAAAFGHLQRSLGCAPLVVHPMPDREYILTSDAATGDSENRGGMGAVLSQLDDNGTERAIAFASRGLKPNEKNYSAYLLELAAAAWAIDNFSVYLRGRRFTLYTDHKPLENLSKIHTKTLNRLQQQLLEYDFDIRYKEGKQNVVADALSRNTIASLHDESGNMVLAQRKDPFCYKLKIFLETGFVPKPRDKKEEKRIQRIGKECFLADNVIWHVLKRNGHRTRNVIVGPRCLTRKILEAAHCSWLGGHAGMDKTLARVQENFWWPGMTSDCDDFIHNCIRCQEAKNTRPPSAPLQSLPTCGEPNERVHMDLFGPLKSNSPAGNKYIMVITDAFTKYVELVALPDKSASTVARAFFEKWICRFGSPMAIVSDRGKEFLNEVMAAMTEWLGTDHAKTSAYHPQSNASAERYNLTMKNYLKSMLENDSTLDWEEWLPALMFSYNTQVHKSTKESPFFLTFLHDPRLPYFDMEKPAKLYSNNYAKEAHHRLGVAYKTAREHMEEARIMREKYYDKMAKERTFAVGDRCLVHFEATKRGGNQKFAKRWRGIYTVTDIVGKVNLKLRASPQSKPILVHVNRVRHLKDSEKQRYLDSKLPPKNSSSDSDEVSAASSRPGPSRRKESYRPGETHTKKKSKEAFSYVREQRQPEGEFAHHNLCRKL